MSGFVAAGVASAMGASSATSTAVGVGTEIAAIGATGYAIGQYGPGVMNAAHHGTETAPSLHSTGIHHMSDAAEMSVQHQHGKQVLPDDMDYSQRPISAGNHEHQSRVDSHKREFNPGYDPTPVVVRAERPPKSSPGTDRKRARRRRDRPPGEPDDPMIQAMMVGPQINDYLNSQGSDRNCLWVESESVVVSLPSGKVAVRLPMSIGGLRYNQPFATYIGMYYTYRARVFEYTFSPIKYDATYQVGSSKTQSDPTITEIAAGAVAETAVLQEHTQALDDGEWLEEDFTAGIPRVGPVTVAIVPEASWRASDKTKMSDANMTTARVLDTSYARQYDCVGGELPSFKVKYTVPVTDDDYSNFIDPFPLAKYRTELAHQGIHSAESVAAHDKVWKRYGMMFACCDKIQRNVECYYVKTRALVEFRGLRDIYLDPPIPNVDSGGIRRNGDRRLVEDHYNPSNNQLEGYANNSNVISNNTTTNMQQVATNASNITTHNQRITALETLATNLKTHAGTVSYNMHLADAAHTLHGRIMTNEDTLGTGVGALYPPTTSGGVTIQPNVPTVSAQVVSNKQLIESNYQQFLNVEYNFSQPTSALNVAMIRVNNMVPSAWEYITAHGTYATGYVSHSSFGASHGFAPASMRYQVYDPAPTPNLATCLKRIFLRGGVRRNPQANIPDQATLFTLDAGYRPGRNLHFIVAGAGGDYASHIQITSAGVVTMHRRHEHDNPPGNAAMEYVTLDGISYWTDGT